MTMKNGIILLLMTIFMFESLFSTDYKSDWFLKKIKNVQYDYYDKVIEYYDSLLKKKPEPEIMLEKCKFIENALYDPDIEDNPKYDEWEKFCRELYESYPDNSDVLIYKLKNTYDQDEAIKLSKQILGIFKNTDNPGYKKNKSIIYQRLANEYSNQKKTDEAIDAVFQALQYNDKAQVHILLARLYKQKGLKKIAKDVIIKNSGLLFPYEINQAAEMLLEMSFVNEALKLYEKIIDSKDVYVNYAKISDAYELDGNYYKARIFLEKQKERAYDKEDSLRKLFKFDLKHSSRELSYDSFRAYRDFGFFMDPLSVYRLQLFFKHPLLFFKPSDWLGLLLIIAILAGCLIVPYLWVLPFHYIGNFINRNRLIRSSTFSLKSLWIISSIFIIISFLSVVLFDYEYFIYDIQDKTRDTISYNMNDAVSILFFIISLTLVTLIFLYRTNGWIILKPASNKYLALLIIAGIISYLVIIRINYLIFPDAAQERIREIKELATNITSVKMLLSSFGLLITLLIVAVLTPFYEEFIFRGIILQSIYKYFPFWLCNVIQAAVFSLLHFDFKMFIPYFAMGFFFGLIYKKTNTIFVSIILHAVNNGIFVLSFYFLLKTLNKL